MGLMLFIGRTGVIGKELGSFDVMWEFWAHADWLHGEQEQVLYLFWDVEERFVEGMDFAARLSHFKGKVQEDVGDVQFF